MRIITSHSKKCRRMKGEDSCSGPCAGVEEFSHHLIWQGGSPVPEGSAEGTFELGGLYHLQRGFLPTSRATCQPSDLFLSFFFQSGGLLKGSQAYAALLIWRAAHTPIFALLPCDGYISQLQFLKLGSVKVGYAMGARTLSTSVSDSPPLNKIHDVIQSSSISLNRSM